MLRKYFFFLVLILGIAACKTKEDPKEPEAPTTFFSVNSIKINGIEANTTLRGLPLKPSITIDFSNAINRASIGNIILQNAAGQPIPVIISYRNNDSLVDLAIPNDLLKYTRYILRVTKEVSNTKDGLLTADINKDFITELDSSDKFPRISENELLDKVQSQTLKYFYDFGHPVSGLARERNTSGDLVTSGGSGFGIMAMIAGANRNFITRQQSLDRMIKIADFLTTKADRFHGVFPHWLNGVTGKTIPFSTNDNGADLVETAYLIQGLLAARQYYDGASNTETKLRADINLIVDAVEWSWFRKETQQNKLYWHWSPDKGFIMNMEVRGWNEALIVYVLAASSKNYSIPKIVYDNGWAVNGSIKNNNSYFGYNLPLGPSNGGPLFFTHYSFLGINPFGLNDQYANYEEQVINHTKINFEYCKANPKKYFGYSKDCWGLTASDIMNGYTASEPNNDVSVIAPTAALSSYPYTPEKSRDALNFFYYKLGDKLWSDKGFYDAFSLHQVWFASSTLAIDQGPIVVMIENHRSKLLWNLFTSCPEVKKGMKDLGFVAPYL